jgi:hypothetical protein
VAGILLVMRSREGERGSVGVGERVSEQCSAASGPFEESVVLNWRCSAEQTSLWCYTSKID